MKKSNPLDFVDNVTEQPHYEIECLGCWRTLKDKSIKKLCIKVAEKGWKMIHSVDGFLGMRIEVDCPYCPKCIKAGKHLEDGEK